MMQRLTFIIFLSFLFLGSCSEQKSKDCTIYLVRHAEKVLEVENPPLNEQGKIRAYELAHCLKDVEFTSVYSTNYTRTLQTINAIAESNQLEIQIYDPKALTAFASELKKISGTILVSGHSNTTPELAILLGKKDYGEIVEEWEYDRLYIIDLDDPQHPKSTLIRYGEPAISPIFKATP